jgi:guanylate kinase
MIDETRRGRIVLLSGPSGVGKGTVIAEAKELAAEQGTKIWESVSDTTRQPREGEVDGVDYNFISHDTFVALMDKGYYLETAVYAENFYGTPKEPILDRSQEGEPVLVELEVQGVAQILDGANDDLRSRLTLVFLAPPDLDELSVRLIGRGTEDLPKIKRRLIAAKNEMKQSSMYDIIIVNHEVERSARLLGRILI